ncbi:hypothetical protein AMATHDRAFT_136895 [Amanita thiersii Skay4041]|uniref:Uncharacterized protein n=1 Tax=Amanita thiersii Skay4041 TaxID=703135 RepID=A0A2A9NYY7_9AGAR|nr:hypothetical protein AMATHDRAFT_136895 [Amanita thiersii Skay4041]
MEEALSKIRPHISSSLLHQRRPATLLIALEKTFREQSSEPSSTAYFAALLTTLEGTIQKNDIGLQDGDILPAELYLLALVLPFVPHPVVRTHLNTLLSLTNPLFPALSSQAPPLRSQLTIYQNIFKALDKHLLDAQGIRQSFASILQLCIDPRPKVRKKAADVVSDVLSVPPSPLLRHPYSERTADWVNSILQGVNSGPKFRSGTSSEGIGVENVIHVLAFLRPVLSRLPATSLSPITTALLALPRLGNPYLSQSAYSLLSDLFTVSAADISNNIGDQIPDVLSVILASPPTKMDTTLAPAWIQVLADSMLAYVQTSPEACANELGKIWKTVWNYLDSNDALTRKATAKSLDALCHCFSPDMISSAIGDNEGKSTLHRIISKVTKALDTLAYAHSIPEVLAVASSLIANLSYRPGGINSPTAAESLLVPLIIKVGDMRTSKGFEHKEKADATLAVAMRVLGPEIVLNALPLNLEPADRQAGRDPRAYLLPLLAQPHPSPLSHFMSYFVPLSERMFDLQQKAEAEGRSSEAKVWSVLVSQVWSGFAGYCSARRDLKESLTPGFAQLLSQILYTQIDLRPSVLKGLKVLVESNMALASPDPVKEVALPATQLSQKEAAANVTFLRSQAESWLAVLFNIFSSINPDSRGMVGEVISVWASITGQEEITKAYKKVFSLFRTNLESTQNVQASKGNADSGNTIAMTQDIILLLLPYLSPEEAFGLFGFCLSGEVLSAKDNAIQKRGYRTLTKLVESGKVQIGDLLAIFQKLDDLLDGISPAAKKDRFNLMAALVPLIPPDSLHIIPSLIPEAVLGTKEPSEKARSSAFDLVVAMGTKMSHGGVVKRSLLDGMDEDDAGAIDVAANIEEFMTMVAGGLAGASPHMISATVTAISRLVFEFKDVVSSKMLNEIVETMFVFLSSANREIVKSVFGFVKLSVHMLPVELLRPHLKQLVPALLIWSHDHKNHFKAKVRHIFERMIRRFGWEEIYGYAGNDDAAKVLVNIKKRKERAKRKKANENGDNGPQPSVKPVAGDAFEDVLYGSESEESEEETIAPHGNQSKKNVKFETRIRMDNNEPMDLLSGAASRVTSAMPGRRRNPGQDATHFKTDEETGKMIIDEKESGNEEDANNDQVAGNAYHENLTSVDGFTRGRNGRVKFNKDTKKRRRENEEQDMDVEMGDETGTTKAKKSKKKTEAPNVGREFKAKKAGGDVRKGGVDPYAYLSLRDTAKKGHGRAKIGITGKR